MVDKPGKAPAPVETEGEQGFDEVMERLRLVVDKLEAGSLGLEQSLAAFEEGVRLSRRGADILDRAEQRVEMLLRGGAGGVGEDDGEKVVPFPGAPGAPAGDANGPGAGGGDDA